MGRGATGRGREEEVGPVEVDYCAEGLWWGANGKIGCVEDEILGLVMLDDVECWRRTYFDWFTT